MTDRPVTKARTRRPESRPAEILEAALDLFSERGFAATRLEDVASRAGLSKAAIYLYFKDKESLLTALVETTIGTRLELAQGLIAAHEGAMSPLLAQILGLLSKQMNESRLPDIIKLVITESRARPEIGRTYLERVVLRALPLFQSLIERGMASGEFRAVDSRLAVKCLVGPMLLGALWRSVFEPLGAEPLDIEALARQHADLFLRGLRP